MDRAAGGGHALVTESLTLRVGEHAGLLGLAGRLLVGAVRDGHTVDVDLVVTELPVPLERGHVDTHPDLVLGTQVEHLVLRDHGEVEEDRDDHERHCRVDQLERHVVRGLTGEFPVVVLLLAMERHRPEDEAPHEEADDQRRDDGARPELTNRDALRGDPGGEPEVDRLVPPLVVGVEATTGQQQAQCAERHSQCRPARPTTPVTLFHHHAFLISGSGHVAGTP